MKFDIIVVGAGPGGCIAARDFASEGFSVGLFDIDEKESLGNSITVEAESDVFGKVGISMPEGEEEPHHQKRMRVFNADKKECFTLEGEHPAVSLRLDYFARRVLGYAEKAGAKFYGGHKALRPIVKDGFVKGVVFKTDKEEVEAEAKITIDASGFNGAVVRGLDADMGIGFEDNKEDVVIAENHFHEINVEKAKEAIDQKLHFDDEVWNRLSLYGNFSTEYSYLSLEDKTAYILIGLRAVADEPPLPDLMDRFKEEQGYYEKYLFGGAGPIRVRRSWDQLVANGFMVIGEAACQVIPAHGSGVASALLAGQMAAKAGVDALKKDDVSAKGLWQYSYEYQTGRGTILACYDANKMVIDSISNDKIKRLMLSGAMASEDLWNAAVPKPISMSVGTLPGRIKGLVTNPDLIGVVITMGKSISAVKKHYQKYPKVYDKGAMDSWRKKAQEIFAPLKSSG